MWICCKCQKVFQEYPSNSVCACGNEDDFFELILDEDMKTIDCPKCGSHIKIPYQDHIKTSEEILTEMAKDAEEEYRLLKLCKEEENDL